MNASSRSRSSSVVASKAKSMVAVGLAVLPDRVALLQEGLHALAGVGGLVRDVAGHALQGDERLGVAVEAAVGRELGYAHREGALVLHRGDEVGDRLLELVGGGGHVGQSPLLALLARQQLAGEQQLLGLAQADVARQAVDRTGAAEQRAADVEVADPGVVRG